MHTSRRRVEELLWIAGLNRAAAPLWDVFRGRRALRTIGLMRDFYSHLLPKDALVFDIGANLGTMTRVFASLGARVVAVEPNPDCARHIQLSTSQKSVEVLQAAIGTANGLGVLKVSDRKDKMSSLSAEWCEAVSKENADYLGMWKREMTVPVITLDALVERYGLPAYIKIDVEGYEEEALKGLSQCPPLLSFEFNKVFPEPALRALDSPLLQRAIFNYTLVDPVKFELQDWIGHDQLKETILNLGAGPKLGDIFARESPRKPA